MHDENTIRLSGSFQLHDALGRAWEVEGIRIFDEGYGIIDVYVDFAESVEEAALHEDALVIRQILARLRALGYSGPDFGPADPGQQDDKLIVLEAPEAFGLFAASKGWKNLAETYAEESDPAAGLAESAPLPDADSCAVFAALMHRMRGQP